MRYLSDIIEEAQTQVFNDTGAFFAFSSKQFDEQKVEGVVYVNTGSGLLCPRGKEEELNRRLVKIAQEGFITDIEENGKKGVIHRELGNHEYSYTHDITATIEALSGYPITETEIRAEVPEYLKAFHEWEDAQEKAAAI